MGVNREQSNVHRLFTLPNGLEDIFWPLGAFALWVIRYFLPTYAMHNIIRTTCMYLRCRYLPHVLGGTFPFWILKFFLPKQDYYLNDDYKKNGIWMGCTRWTKVCIESTGKSNMLRDFDFLDLFLTSSFQFQYVRREISIQEFLLWHEPNLYLTIFWIL